MAPESVTVMFGVMAEEITELRAGHINRTYLVTSGDEKYILQSLNASVYTKPGIVERNICEVMRCFRSADDVGVPEYLSCSQESILVRSGSEIWRMYRYIPGGVPASQAPACAGYTCGAFIRTLGSGSPELSPSIEGFHSFSHHFRQFTEAAEGYAMNGELSSMTAFLTDIYSRISGVFADLPVRPIHGDAKGDNFILTGSVRGGTAIDLDNVMYSYAAIDYGDLIRSLAGAGDLSAAEQVTRGFAAGTAGVLSPEEEDSLYDGVIYVSAELAVRYLTDFIKGAVFFRSKTPEQCLERARQLCVQLKAFDACADQFRSMTERCFRKG